MTWNTKFDQLPTQVIEGLCKPTPKSSYSHASGASWEKFKTVIDSVAKWDIESEPDFPAITEQIKKFTDQINNQIKFNSIGREDQNEILVTADVFPNSLSRSLFILSKKLKRDDSRVTFSCLFLIVG